MRIFAIAVLCILLVPAFALAAGPHDGLDCVGCHAIHTAKGDIIFAVAPNSKAVNKRGNKPFSGVTALCLGCHENNGGMGIMPVASNHSHPYGVKVDPKIATMPAKLLRDGKLECIGCHDPHPSNPNHKYLRVKTKGGSNMQHFCDLCHPSKSGVVVSDAETFNSMDERTFKPKTTKKTVNKTTKTKKK